MPKVFAFAPMGDSHRFLEENGCEVLLGRKEWHVPGGNYDAEMAEYMSGAAAAYGTSIRATPISRRVLEASPDLRIVAKGTVGVDEIDLDAAEDLGILITHAPVESNWGNIAETTVMFMLSLLKGQNVQDETIKNGGWWTVGSQGAYVGSRASDSHGGITLGIIGLGRIGARVAQLMRPWNITILAYDPYIPEHRFLESGARPVDLETLLRESDVVSVHVVLTRETRNMIDAAQLELMKPTAYVLNTARGGTVNETALINAIDSGRIAGAGLNAFEQEPLPPESPLRYMGNKVILRPHGGSLPAGAVTVGRSSGLNTQWVNSDVLKALSGVVPDHVYNVDVIPRWRARFGGKNLFK
jgi:phosphoglycerate dehydrogenase-like enzyme